MTIFRIPIFLLTIVHDGNWKINAEICSIFVHSIDIFLAKERENVSHWNIMEKVPDWRTFSGMPSGWDGSGADGERYTLRLQIAKSFVRCEQNRFPCGKERVFPEKNENSPLPFGFGCASMYFGKDWMFRGILPEKLSFSDPE